MNNPWVFGINDKWFIKLTDVHSVRFSKDSVILYLFNSWVVLLTKSNKENDERLISQEQFDFIKRYFGVE